jgi:hypothetical protein
MAVMTPGGDEAAAVAAAIARFEAEVGAVPVEAPAQVSAWQRAALVEGVSAKKSLLEAEGGAKWLS